MRWRGRRVGELSADKACCARSGERAARLPAARASRSVRSSCAWCASVSRTLCCDPSGSERAWRGGGRQAPGPHQKQNRTDTASPKATALKRCHPSARPELAGPAPRLLGRAFVERQRRGPGLGPGRRLAPVPRPDLSPSRFDRPGPYRPSRTLSGSASVCVMGQAGRHGRIGDTDAMTMLRNTRADLSYSEHTRPSRSSESLVRGGPAAGRRDGGGHSAAPARPDSDHSGRPVRVLVDVSCRGSARVTAAA